MQHAVAVGDWIEVALCEHYCIHGHRSTHAARACRPMQNNGTEINGTAMENFPILNPLKNSIFARHVSFVCSRRIPSGFAVILYCANYIESQVFPLAAASSDLASDVNRTRIHLNFSLAEENLK